MGKLMIKRVYSPASEDDGYRLLIDRLWPRGVAKAAAGVDEWCKAVAPTASLRQWFGHKPELFEEFACRYRTELAANDAAKALAAHCCELLKERNVTLLYGSRDEQHNHALVLRDWLLEHM